MGLRQRVRDALRSARGGWISGQQLGAALGVSRAAVSKHVKALQQEGYRIESATRKGYRLRKDDDPVSAVLLREALRTRALGQVSISYRVRTGSTNDDAKHAASQGAPHGSVFLADTQTAGRGRLGRSWISPPGVGVYISVILQPDLALGDVPLVSIAAALATAEAVREQTTLPVRIKWPNDVLLCDKKVAGVLTEMSADMDRVEYVVVGVGINVNTPSSALPADRLIYPASSLMVEAGERACRVAVVAKWLERLEHWVDCLVAQGGDPLVRAWQEASGSVGQQVCVSTAKETVEGRIVGLGEGGALTLKLADGSVRSILSGDLTPD